MEVGLGLEVPPAPAGTPARARKSLYMLYSAIYYYAHARATRSNYYEEATATTRAHEGRLVPKPAWWPTATPAA